MGPPDLSRRHSDCSSLPQKIAGHGDLSLALDQIAKEEVCKLTGKDDYEVQQNQHMNTRTYEHGHGRARSSGARPV